MASRLTRTVRCKALRLARWNAGGVRGRKLELEDFLSQHGDDRCLLIETFLNLGQALRLTNYNCHRIYRPTAEGSESILVRRGIVHHKAGCCIDSLGGHSCLSHIGRQNGEIPCCPFLTFPPTDRSGPDRLFRRRIAGPHGR